MRQDCGRRGIARDDDRVGRVIRNEMGHYRADARDQRGFGEPAIGKTCIVRREKAAHVRPQAHHFRQNGQATQSRIEDENVRRF